MKKSEGKETLPGKKQVFRQYHENIMEKDILTIEGDKREGQPLLKSFMKNGTRTSKPASLKEIQEYTLEQLKHLPKHFKELQTTPAYPVEISEELYMLKEEVRQKIGLIP